jgi:hypothetical protein
MYAPHQVPEGPHYVYILHDQTRSWFKIGETRDVEDRRKIVTWQVLGGNSLHRLKVYRTWIFQNYYAAIHVEQAAMGLMKNIGLSPVRRPDWFELDCTTMDAAIVSIDELAKSIDFWEKRNASLECSACDEGEPYGDYIWDTDWVTFEHLFEEDDGRITRIEIPMEQRLAEKKTLYERWRKKMPRGLAELVAQMEASLQTRPKS